MERLSCSQPATEVPRLLRLEAESVKEPEAESQEVELKEVPGVADNCIPNSTTYAKDGNTQIGHTPTGESTKGAD